MQRSDPLGTKRLSRALFRWLQLGGDTAMVEASDGGQVSALFCLSVDLSQAQFACLRSSCISTGSALFAQDGRRHCLTAGCPALTGLASRRSLCRDHRQGPGRPVNQGPVRHQHGRPTRCARAPRHLRVVPDPAAYRHPADLAVCDAVAKLIDSQKDDENT